VQVFVVGAEQGLDVGTDGDVLLHEISGTNLRDRGGFWLGKESVQAARLATGAEKTPIGA
jgi:hypothetical protein